MAEDVQPSARDEQARRLAETLRRQLGATLCGLMQAPDVVELMLNPDGRVWVDRLGGVQDGGGWGRRRYDWPIGCWLGVRRWRGSCAWLKQGSMVRHGSSMYRISGHLVASARCLSW